MNKLLEQLDRLQVGDYSTPLAFSKMVFDPIIVQEIQQAYTALDGATVTDIVLVGIGGSHFGVQAIYDALAASSYREPAVTLHALTSIDSFDTAAFIEWYSKLLCDNRRVITFVVSKSGTTFETASQASLCFELLKKYCPDDYRKKLCIITDHDSVLWRASKQEELYCLAIPKVIGGRYSVFSAAGLVLLHFLKIDIQQLLAGAQVVDLTQPVTSAQALYSAFQAGFLVHDTFIFMPHYAALGGWVRQLIGESLGKDNKGFLPTVSLGSQDLHSVVQHYFGGKQITITSFLIPQEYPNTLSVGDTLFSRAGSLKPGLTFSALQKAIIDGVLVSYTKAEKPYFVYNFRPNNAYDIGYFMQYKMFETVYVGTLMGVDPFDQPQVELYKQETRALL